MSVELYANEFANLSPYNYAGNNPVMNNDPTGGRIYPTPDHLQSWRELLASGGGGGPGHSIGPGSGNHWAVGINFNDWTLGNGSPSYRKMLGNPNYTERGNGNFYFQNPDGRDLKVRESNGEVYVYNPWYIDDTSEKTTGGWMNVRSYEGAAFVKNQGNKRGLIFNTNGGLLFKQVLPRGMNYGITFLILIMAQVL